MYEIAHKVSHNVYDEHCQQTRKAVLYGNGGCFWEENVWKYMGRIGIKGI